MYVSSRIKNPRYNMTITVVIIDVTKAFKNLLYCSCVRMYFRTLAATIIKYIRNLSCSHVQYKHTCTVQPTLVYGALFYAFC